MTSCPPRRQFLEILGLATATAALGLPRGAHAAGLSLADIKGSGKLRIGVEAAYVPFTFRKDGKVVGYDVDLADIFCESLGVSPTSSTPRGPASSRRSTPRSST
jgi:ABC-type amino acid transport substrate-binding protein